MKTRPVVACAVAAASLIACAQGVLKLGSDAPDFTAQGTDGKSHSLKSLTAKGDVFLYFISDSCPVNAQAEKYYNRLSNAYKGKATIVGVINTNEKGFKAWQEQFKAPFTVLYDPELKIIRSYKANASPWMIHVKAGKIANVWTGYSQPYLQEINKAMAASAKTAVAKVDFAGSPANYQFG